MPAMADNYLRTEGGAMPRLDDTAVEEDLWRLPGWERRGHQIARPSRARTSPTRWCSSTRSPRRPRRPAITPDIDLRWNTVTLALSSHAEGGLTDRDFQLAARIQELDQPAQPA
jgi:4a-hydroxytetrahydrobiopterin dehydratase